jgi:hypothetical protein
MKTILAIDPGASGGMAWRVEDAETQCMPMPDTEGDIVDHLRKLACSYFNNLRVAYIEHVGGFTRAGGGQPGSAMFKFGRGVGVLHGALLAFGWRVIEVRPQEWQARLGVGKSTGCATKCEWKNKLKAEAQRRFPECSVTLKTADALLIFDYAVAKEGA